jgi:O-antigen chain-terminating methyltransferase
MITENELVALYRELGEQYQPIWGIKLPDQVSRLSSDREEQILEIMSQLTSKLGRKLRILDIGASQGYFSCVAAKLGHHVTAVEYDNKNLEFLVKLKEFHDFEQIEIFAGGISEFISGDNSNYDLVFCLSVLHHVYHFEGAPSATRLLNWISKNSTAVVFELALRSEQYMYWSKSLPEFYWQDLEEFSFISEFGGFSNHLGSKSRPLILASNKFQFIDGVMIDDSSLKRIFAHENADKNAIQRRVYRLQQRLYKSGFALPDSKNEVQEEFEILKSGKLNYLSNGDLNPIVHHSSEFLFMYSRAYIPGQILTEITDSQKLRQSTPALVALVCGLQKKGLFHNDLRPWNIVLHEGRPTFIDFGNISTNECDVSQLSSELVLVLNCYYLINQFRDWNFENLKPLIKSMEFRTFVQDFVDNYRNPIFNSNHQNLIREIRNVTSARNLTKKYWLVLKHQLKIRLKAH